MHDPPGMRCQIDSSMGYLPVNAKRPSLCGDCRIVLVGETRLFLWGMFDSSSCSAEQWPGLAELTLSPYFPNQTVISQMVSQMYPIDTYLPVWYTWLDLS